MDGGPKLAGRKPNNINSILLNIKKISILFLVNNRKLFGIKLGLSWICVWRKIRKTYMRDAFCLSKILNA